MQESAANKTITSKTPKTVTKQSDTETVKQQYFYPDHQITVEAESMEEAEKLLTDRLAENEKTV